MKHRHYPSRTHSKVLSGQTVFCQVFPAELIFITKVLRLADIDAQALHGGMSQKERDAVIDTFQNSDVSNQALSLSFAMRNYGLNFDYKCHRSVHIDPPPSIPIGHQSIGRIRRITQRCNVLRTSALHMYHHRQSAYLQRYVHLLLLPPGAPCSYLHVGKLGIIAVVDQSLCNS